MRYGRAITGMAISPGSKQHESVIKLTKCADNCFLHQTDNGFEVFLYSQNRYFEHWPRPVHLSWSAAHLLDVTGSAMASLVVYFSLNERIIPKGMETVYQHRQIT